MNLSDAWPDWSGYACVIVASGPSAKDCDLSLARGRAKFIAINNSWNLAPWADVLYAADHAWWRANEGCPDFKGMKVSAEQRSSDFGAYHVDSSKPTDQFSLVKGKIGWGGNSGFQALNLAFLFGCNPILLVGYDMRLDGGVHWHGHHTGNLRNPREGNVRRWRNAVDTAASVISDAGVRVVNCSPVSALQNYEKMPFEEALCLATGS